MISGVERQQHAFSRVPCVTTVAAGQKRNVVTRYVIRHALGGGAEVGASITPAGGGGGRAASISVHEALAACLLLCGLVQCLLLRISFVYHGGLIFGSG